jgi:hypothetical protein
LSLRDKLEVAVVQPPWSRLPGDLAARLNARLASTAEALAAAAIATPRFAEIADPKFTADVDTAVRVALERFVALIGTSDPALPTSVRDVYVGLGAAEARDERGTEVLVTALRAAARALFRIAATELAETGAGSTDELVDLSDAIQSFVDELADAANEGFTEQVRELAGEGDRLRRHLAELILGGNATPEQVSAASAAIGWRSLSTVVPVLLPLEQARHARFRYSADGLVVERNDDVVLLLREGRHASPHALSDSLRGRGAVIGTATVYPAVPHSVLLMERTRALVKSAHADHEAEPVLVTDHLVELALAGFPEALTALRAQRLAAFELLPSTQRERLLETLASWLRHWGSRGAVAGELFVHPQTVSYRIRRLRELLGDDLDNPAKRFELQLVLVEAR